MEEKKSVWIPKLKMYVFVSKDIPDEDVIAKYEGKKDHDPSLDFKKRAGDPKNFAFQPKKKGKRTKKTPKKRNG